MEEDISAAQTRIAALHVEVEKARSYQAQCDMLSQEKTEWTSAFRGLLSESRSSKTSQSGSGVGVVGGGAESKEIKEEDIFDESLGM